ncbi:MAG: IclR family transcriptional regulator [Roseiarcus sp.]
MTRQGITKPHPEGSQSIARAVELLARVAERSETGARLSELAESTGLHVATARRIMQPLVAEGLLALNLKTKVYTVGPTIFSFAIQGNLWCSRRELYMPAVENIALRMRDTAFFSVRSANESVCLARRNGDFPLRVMSLEKGSRRPLGDGSGSLAILAFLPDERRSEILEQCASLYERFDSSVSMLSKTVAETRQAGFSFNPGRIIEDDYGLGVPIPKDGVAVGFVSVAAIASRMTPARRQEIVGIISDEIAAISGCELPASLAPSVNPNNDKGP